MKTPLSLAPITPSREVISSRFHSVWGLRARVRASSSPSLLGPSAPPRGKI